MDSMLTAGWREGWASPTRVRWSTLKLCLQGVMHMKRIEIINGTPMIRVDSDEDVVVLSTGYRRIKGMDVDEHGFEHEVRS